MSKANSSNCLTEAFGLSLSGNGALVATHSEREQFSLEAGRKIVSTAKSYYDDRCIVKTAGVGESILTFIRRARIFESQEAAVKGILGDTIEPGDVTVVRHEGPKGGPGMQEMRYPTSYLKSKNLGKVCALITDWRFSGGSSGLSVGHISPEVADGGLIGLIEENDTIEIDIPNRRIHLTIGDDVIEQQRSAINAREHEAWKPDRRRQVSAALRAYGTLATSAANGAVRDGSDL